MFNAEDRLPVVREMIMASTEEERRARARPAAADAAVRLRGDLRGDGGAAGDDPPARPAAARVPARPRGCDRRARCASGSSSSARRTRCSARAAAGSGCIYPEIYEMQVRAIVARRDRGPRANGRRAAGRDHAPARRVRGGAAPAPRADDRGRRGGGRARLPGRDDDRAPARVHPRRRDRARTPTSSRSARTT